MTHMKCAYFYTLTQAYIKHPIILYEFLPLYILSYVKKKKSLATHLFQRQGRQWKWSHASHTFLMPAELAFGLLQDYFLLKHGWSFYIAGCLAGLLSTPCFSVLLVICNVTHKLCIKAHIYSRYIFVILEADFINMTSFYLVAGTRLQRSDLLRLKRLLRHLRKL